jgi:hypothetical protein
VLDVLAKKIVKLTMDLWFSGNGYCSKVNSRAMLLELYGDVIHLQNKFCIHLKRSASSQVTDSKAKN